MDRAHGERGGDGKIWYAVVVGDRRNQAPARPPVLYCFTYECVENGAAGVSGLKFLLKIKRVKDVIGMIDGELGGIGVERNIGPAGDDIGIMLFVVQGKPETGTFRRSRLTKRI